tara:strand:+ start:358 stop:594 length:237 start_codon:yes stop_codon:yes gene_type:complete
MEIHKKIVFGKIDHTYLSSWKSDNEVELHKDNDVVLFTMSEEVMTQLHKKLGDKLTQIAAERIEEAHKLAQEEQSEDE